MKVNMETRIFVNENARKIANYIYNKYYPLGGRETIRITNIGNEVDLWYADGALDDKIMIHLPCDAHCWSDYKTYIDVTVTY